MFIFIKVSSTGVLQPFSNAMKLLSREQHLPLVSDCTFYYFSPVPGLILSLLILLLIPHFKDFMYFKLGLVFFYVVLSRMFIL
jgi:NADH-ubiquinone oxidoreductase chain 1